MVGRIVFLLPPEHVGSAVGGANTPDDLLGSILRWVRRDGVGRVMEVPASREDVHGAADFI